MPFLAIVWCRDATAVRDVRHRLALEQNHVENSPVVGVFAYPARADLTCRGYCGGKVSPWVRDPKGFMRCGVCGGRHRDTRRRLLGSLFDNLGANKLKNPPTVFRTPEGYR